MAKSVPPDVPMANGMKLSVFDAQSQEMPVHAVIPRWKRAIDVMFVLLILPLALPLAILISVTIRLVSAGPILFRQERIGHLEQRFMCLKFRTMFVGVESVKHQEHLHQLIKSDAPMVKLDSHGDSRIIPFGRLLRASGLDELPQLINVLRGEMSLVGPRPCTVYEREVYLPWQRERFSSLPGLTGLWQVSGKNRTSFVEMIEMDIRYTRSKTLWLDLMIILRTLPAILSQLRQAWKQRGSAGGRRR